MNGVYHASNGSSSAPSGPLASTSSASTANGYSSAHSPPYQDPQHAIDLAHYVYNEAYLESKFSDVRLQITFGSAEVIVSRRAFRPAQPLQLHQAYSFHKLILARSPYLRRLLLEQTGHDVVLHVTDPYITKDAICTAVGCLYSATATSHLTYDTARSILAAAMFLQLTDLSELALDYCRSVVASLTDPTQIAEWFAFVQTPALSYSEPSTPRDASPERLYYGPAAVELREQLLFRIARTLPVQLAAFSTVAPQASPNAREPHLQTQTPTTGGPASTTGQAHLIQIYAALPFALFKRIMESADFPPGDMERFSFAKRCIAERKRAQGKDAPFTETAVLAFGSTGAGSSNVEIVAKPKKGARLWKVGDQ